MPIKITFEEILKLKARETIPMSCDQCGKDFCSQTKHSAIKIGYSHKDAKTTLFQRKRFCSKKCYGDFFNKELNVKCKNCNETFKKSRAEYLKRANHFCSRSCSATYNNKHKTKGFRRSKLEVFIEKQLAIIFPSLEVLCNDRKEIGLELDFYIPSLRLAFELNGIFHYEPIYGGDKLNQIQYNDSQKFKLCHEKSISLCVIDTTGLKYFKESKAKEYLALVKRIIGENILLVR